MTGSRWKRLSLEGRLRTGDSFERGDQFGLTNVIHRLPVQEILDGYHRVMASLYSPADYFQRCRDNLSQWKGRRELRLRLTLGDLRAGAKAVIEQGLRSSYRREYWRFLAWTIGHQPRKRARALTQAATGHHYITYTRDAVLPALRHVRERLLGPSPAPSLNPGTASRR